MRERHFSLSHRYLKLQDHSSTANKATLHEWITAWKVQQQLMLNAANSADRTRQFFQQYEKFATGMHVSHRADAMNSLYNSSVLLL